MKDKQELLRKRCKFLKWAKDISYGEMAQAIGMEKNSFYNFVSGRKCKISRQKQVNLANYLHLKEIQKDEKTN